MTRRSISETITLSLGDFSVEELEAELAEREGAPLLDNPTLALLWKRLDDGKLSLAQLRELEDAVKRILA